MFKYIFFTYFYSFNLDFYLETDNSHNFSVILSIRIVWKSDKIKPRKRISSLIDLIK